MAKTTTTVRVYPDDIATLKATRMWLQKLYGSDHTIADAVHYAMVNLTITNPSILAMLEE